jgi:hypothetical protein
VYGVLDSLGDRTTKVSLPLEDARYKRSRGRKQVSSRTVPPGRDGVVSCGSRCSWLGQDGRQKPSPASVAVPREWLVRTAPTRFDPSGRAVRNREWVHMVNDHVISMPDKWEYPWYAAWDLAFHAVALSSVDVDFAKAQLELLLREI